MSLSGAEEQPVKDNFTQAHRMNAFIAAMLPFTPLSENSQAALAGVAKRLEWPKGRILSRAHTVSAQVYFIEQGLARTYYYKGDKQVTDWLSAEGEFTGSMSSYLTQQPDRRQVELLEPSLLWAVPFWELDQLYRTDHAIERLGRLLVSHGLVLLQQRFDELHFATAAERYENLRQRHPTLLQRVPLSMLASYLGMTQETLSRIRRPA
jgi:CRP-like cAMP-binding protein